MYEGNSWNASNFNKSKLFEEYFHLMGTPFAIKFDVGRVSLTSPLQHIIVDILFLF